MSAGSFEGSNWMHYEATADRSTRPSSTVHRALWCVIHPFVRPALVAGDTEEQVMRKWVVVVSVLGTLVNLVGPGLVVGFLRTDRFEDMPLHWLYLIAILACLVAYGWMLRRKRVSNVFLTSFAAFLTLSICIVDLFGSVVQVRYWAAHIVVIDVLLVCNVPLRYVTPLVALMCAWLTVMGAEKGLRFGLFDLPGLPGNDHRRRVTDCASPPCGHPAWVSYFLSNVIVVLVEFFVTRTFAHEVSRRKLALEESVAVARLLVEHLAAYDLDAADRCLQAGKLPADMAAVFNDLLANLKTYRPFLPDGLFRMDMTPEELESDQGSSTLSELYVVASAAASPVGSPAPSPVTASPRAQMPSRRASLSTLKLPARLESKRMTLVAMVQDLSVTLDDAAEYVTSHTETLCRAFDVVKARRGSLDYFHGERVYASFNAFDIAQRHVEDAVAAVVDLWPVMGTAAVVTGTAHAGYLGAAEKLRSPVVVGALAGEVGQMLRAAVAARERTVVCVATARAANYRFAMRHLLHTFYFADETRERSDTKETPTALYALEAAPDMMPEQDAAPSPVMMNSEWMYQLEGSGILAWAAYNAAAKAFVSNGRAAGEQSVCAATDADDPMRFRFLDDACAAMIIDLRASCAPVAGGVRTPDSIPVSPLSNTFDHTCH
eukprot:TRINITY_DN2544_c0_g5_i2.p1 TRINITY_DN2544_c0_g5~~TRINITY_DN2544_c0_g5_i2.p1  ORF type:complete len:681 (+),score=160.68 TRINITY_DN2544_c0_g5_i2:62-2044(+)